MSHWTGTPKPLTFTPDDSPIYQEPGWEPKEHESVLPLLVAIGFMALVGAVAILRRIV